MSHPVITVGPEASIKEAARLLARHAISALPVVDTGGALVGIVSEADLIPIEARPDPRRQATPMRPTAGTTPRGVADVMTSPVITVEVDSEVSTAARLMIEADVKRLPVMDGRRLAGIVSRRDLVKVLATSDEDVRSELGRRLREAGVGLMEGAVAVKDGIATVQIEDRGPNRRLAESIAMTVPGVLEVRFTS
jgi:CBS domain-containing protein